MSMRRFHTVRSSRNHVSGRRTRVGGGSRTAKAYETLEARTMLCGQSWHVDPPAPVIEERPELVGKPRDSSLAGVEPANIVWVNRGQASDNFAARFGTLAPQARAVVDAVIDYYELMIGSFNYSTSGQSYSLTLGMGADGGGFGAAAGIHTSLGGKPKSGGVEIGAGNADGLPNSDNGWFIDPTPYDNSEFMGSIVNAFSGDAQVGSPAFGRADFFTVVALEMAHTMGAMGSFLSGWSNLTTDTGVADTSEGGGTGTFWTFNGPSIDHLLSSFNSGGGGTNWGSALHGAGPNVTVNFGGKSYIGAQDIGNAIYENGRRYMVSNTFSLMYKDAYGYASIDPARFGTFYSSPFQAADGIVRVRGGTGTSNDTIQIFRSASNTLTISVDVGTDVGGTGATSGTQNLPAFTSVYDVGQVSNIIVDAGAGDDNIFIDTTNFSAALAESMAIVGGDGNDSLTTTFFGGNLNYLTGFSSFDGGLGSDSIVMYDNASTAADAYSITNNLIDRVTFGGLAYSNTESIALNGQTGGNTFNIASSRPGTNYTLDGRGGNDVFNIGLNGGNAIGVLGGMNYIGGAGTDTLYINDFTNTSGIAYQVTNTTLFRNTIPTWVHSGMESMALNAGSGDDVIILDTGSGSFPLEVYAGNGNDQFNIHTDNYNVFAAQNPIFVEGGGGTDSATLRTASGGFFYNVQYNSFGGTFLPAYGYSNTLENLTIEGGSGNETYLLFETRATLSTVVNGNDGGDMFYFGAFFGATYTLDSIDGPVYVNGGPDGGVMALIDTLATTNQNYTLAANVISRTGAANISYDSIGRVELYGGSANEAYFVGGTGAQTGSMLFDGNAGQDTWFVTDHAPATAITVDGDIGLDFVTVQGSGATTVRFDVTQDLASLSVNNGGNVVVTPNANAVIETDALTVGAGKLDLNDNDLIIDYAEVTPRATIQSLINAARSGGTWTGNGITSTAAKNANPRNTMLGVLEASEFKSMYGAGATFAGRAIDATAVLVKYTYYGDADFNGAVNFDDYSRTDGGFNFGRTGWLNGDFDSNGTVNFDDYSLIDLAFNTQGGALRPGGGQASSRRDR